jgi:hypothetical protein
MGDAVTGSIEVTITDEYIYKKDNKYYHYVKDLTRSEDNIQNTEISEQIAREIIDNNLAGWLASTVLFVTPDNFLNQEPDLTTIGQTRGTDLVVTIDAGTYGIWMTYEFDDKGIVKRETTRQVAEYGEVEIEYITTSNTTISTIVPDDIKNAPITE